MTSFNIRSSHIAIDTETTGLDTRMGDRPFYVSFTDYEGYSTGFRGEVDPLTREVSFSEKNTKKILEILTTPSIKLMHNAKFDIAMLEAQFGDGCINGKILDTLVLAHVDNSSRPMGLKPLGDVLFNISEGDMKDLKADVVRKRREVKRLGWAMARDVEADYWMAEPSLLEIYAHTDTERTMALYWVYEDRLKSDTTYKALVDMEHQVLWVSKEMEDEGVGIDLEKCQELEIYYSEIIKEQEEKIAELGYPTLNLNSPKQLQEVFYEQKGYPIQYASRKTADGMKKTPTVSSKVMKGFAKKGDELARAIISRKEAFHQLNNFIRTFLSENHGGILHPNYKTCGPITGRISCTKPNLMNISNSELGDGVEVRVRECFIPREKDTVLYFVDYSQVEVWVAMFLSRDEHGMEALLDGADMHGNMALRAWAWLTRDHEEFQSWRGKAKGIMFGLMYGAGAGVVRDIVGCSDAEAKRIRDVFWATYNGLYEYSQRLQDDVGRNGRIVNPFGREYYVDGRSPYKALNYMIQGTAAEIMKRALISIRNRLLFRVHGKFRPAKLLMTIHDEVCVEADVRDLAVPRIIAESMVGDFHEILDIPQRMKCEVSIAKSNWGQKEVLAPQPTLFGEK